jgi:hypothetical protein
MKILVALLLVASLALNVAFLTGCATLGMFFTQEPQPVDEAREALVRIAVMLDIPTAGKSVYTLESDIRQKLEHGMSIPAPFDQTTFEKTVMKVNPMEEGHLRDCQRFLLRLQGKRVIVLDGKD